jgi:hypothetical protein
MHHYMIMTCFMMTSEIIFVWRKPWNSSMGTADLRLNPGTSDCFRQALQVMSCAYSSRNLTFPLGRLQALLLYKTYEQVEIDCRQYNIAVKDNAVSFCKQSFQPNTHVSSSFTQSCQTCYEQTFLQYIHHCNHSDVSHHVSLSLHP